MYHEGTDLSVSVTSSSPSEQMICPSFTLKADALAPYCAITTIQTTLLRSLNWHVSAQGSKYAIRYSYLGSSHYACGKWGWTTQPSVLSLSCCRHSDSQCGLVTQWLHTLIQPYQNCVVNENFKVTFHALLCLSVAVSLRGEWELSSDLQSFEFCLAALTPPRSLRTGRRERKG